MVVVMELVSIAKAPYPAPQPVQIDPLYQLIFPQRYNPNAPLIVTVLLHTPLSDTPSSVTGADCSTTVGVFTFSASFRQAAKTAAKPTARAIENTVLFFMVVRRLNG